MRFGEERGLYLPLTEILKTCNVTLLSFSLACRVASMISIKKKRKQKYECGCGCAPHLFQFCINRKGDLTSNSAIKNYFVQDLIVVSNKQFMF